MVGAGLVLLAVAAVLTWGVDTDLPYVDDATLSSVALALGLTLGMVLVWGLEVDIPQVEDETLGLILMLGGVVSIVATVYLDRQRSRTRRVVELRRGRGTRGV